MTKKPVWPLRFSYRGADVTVTHKCSPLITWGASVMSVNIIPMHLRIEIEKQVREAEKRAVLAVNEEMARAENLAVASPRRVQQNQRRVRNAEQPHYGVSARAVQRRSRSGG